MDSSDHLRTFSDERRAWREQILNGMLWATTITCTILILWSLVDSTYSTSAWKSYAIVGGACLGMLVFHGIPFVARVSIFLFGFYVAIVAALADTGLAPNVFIALAILVVVSTLLLGRLPALLVTVLLIVTMILLHYLHLSGALTRPTNWMLQLDIQRTQVVTRVASVFLMTSLMLILAISHLLKRTENAVRDTIATVARLEEEHAAKVKAEADLEKHEAAFRRASELEVLGRLSGSVAHDFNNALLVIFSALDEIGERSPLWNTHADALSAIRSAAHQAAATTRQLRSLGPGRPVVEAPLALAPALRRAAVLLQRILPASIRLTVIVDDEVAIAADENIIQRILTNLALNARDAMKESGTVTLRVCSPAAEEGGPYARIEVSDTGAGMSPEVQARIFEPFFTTKTGTGTGLGLSSVKELVTNAGGHLHVSSAPNLGTTIAVCWPMLTEWMPPIEPVTPSPTVAARLTVLFVDDDPIVRRALVRGLHDYPIKLLEASTGDEAMEIARRHQDPIHVLCTDCMMPGLHVKDLVAEFRLQYPNGKVMVCSGYEPDDAGLALGMVDDFFPKPFSASELAARIRQVALKAR